jgi:hypothetical protein
MNSRPGKTSARFAFAPGTGDNDNGGQRSSLSYVLQYLHAYREWATVENDGNFWRLGCSRYHVGIGSQNVYDLAKLRMPDIPDHKDGWPARQHTSLFASQWSRHLPFLNGRGSPLRDFE